MRMWPPWASVNCIIKLFFCRNKVLTTEVKALKQQMATVLEKGRHDDELIAALMVSFSFFAVNCMKIDFYCFILPFILTKLERNKDHNLLNPVPIFALPETTS